MTPYITCPLCGMNMNSDCSLCRAGMGLPPLASPPTSYRDHLRSVTNDLHRKLTGCKTGSSSYKITWGKWVQAGEDLAAWKRMVDNDPRL